MNSPVSSGGSFIHQNDPKSFISSESDTDSVMDISETDRSSLDYRKLGK